MMTVFPVDLEGIDRAMDANLLANMRRDPGFGAVWFARSLIDMAHAGALSGQLTRSAERDLRIAKAFLERLHTVPVTEDTHHV